MQKTLIRPTKITTEICTITPDIAAAYLEKNQGNRTVSNAAINKLAADMRKDRWQLTGDAIRFDRDGRLIDGQHRLMACVRAKASFKTVVMYGLDPNAQDVIDSGKARRAADVLSIRGSTHANQLASALRMLIEYKAGAYNGMHLPITTMEIVEALERNPNITKSVAVCTHKMPRSTPRRALALIHYTATIFLGLGDKANAMVDVYRHGVPTYDGDPIHTLRERIIMASSAPTRMTPASVDATAFHAWNMFAKGKPVNRAIRFRTEFTEIDGFDRSKL